MTPLELQQLRTIIRKLIVGDETFFDNQEISWDVKGDYWVLNYGLKGRTQYNRLCRGLVIKKPKNFLWGWLFPLKLIASFPFTRFFNHGESYVNSQGEKCIAGLDFATSTMVEKLDGTMVGVFFPQSSKPQWHTRRMISTHEVDMQMKIAGFHNEKLFSLMSLIGDYVDILHFEDAPTNYTYIFEFIHENNRVVTQYGSVWNGLWLLGMRNLETLEEVTDQQLLDRVAKKIGCCRPKIFEVQHNKIEQIKVIMNEYEEFVENFEGVVFIDLQGNRLKLKRVEYVELHHMLGELSYKHLTPKILTGEEDEIIAYFPHAKILVDKFKQHYEDFCKVVVSRIRYWKGLKLDRKTLAFQVITQRGETVPFIQCAIMKSFERKDEEIEVEVDQALRMIGLGFGKQEGNINKILELIDLK